MHWLIPLALIVAGIIAASALIISKAPQAKDAIAKLAPFQGFIGVGLLAVGVYRLIWLLGNSSKLSNFPWTLWLIAIYAGIVCALLLGFLLGMPLIAKWIPGESSAEQKAMEMQQKILPYQTIIGVVALVAAVILIFYNVTQSKVASFIF